MKRTSLRLLVLVPLVLGVVTPVRGQAPAPAEGQAPVLPLKLEPRPTSAAITAADLMTRLYIVADDSMMGREAGTLGNYRATSYIARELERLGLRPAGADGTYFQAVPLVNRVFDRQSTLAAAPGPLQFGSDFIPLPPAQEVPFGAVLRGREIETIYGGRIGGELVSSEAAHGKLVILGAPLGPDGKPSWQFFGRSGIERFPTAAGVAVATLDISPAGLAAWALQPSIEMQFTPESFGNAPAGLLVSSAAAERILGRPLDALRPGAKGKPVAADMRWVGVPTERPARNVVAMLPGSDPALRDEYVAIGAHNDHDGMAPAVDHDSVALFNSLFRPLGVASPTPALTAAQAARFRASMDSIRALRPPRADSVFNGADDDGSGTVAVLEIAEALAGGTAPRRSVLFVWHTGEEKGLVGARHFTENPTVPRDAIVAQLNIDMIGRHSPELTAGEVGVIGARRLSTELGAMLDAATADHGVTVDFGLDAAGHPQNYYCRSDHYMYARYGIPVAFFFTGSHSDYHQRSDEPQYIDYPQMERITTLVHDLARRVADRDRRPAVDGERMDPNAPCQQ